MPSFAKMFDNLKLKIYDKYSQNPAGICIAAGSLSWALGCVAQVGALIFNDKLSKKDKTFLVPQEIADGAVNVGLFLGLTTVAQKIAGYSLESGKIMFAETKNALSDVLTTQNKTLEQALKDNGGKISEILKNTQHLDKFIKLKGGACLAAALLGSIISCNILTPIARNFIGAKWQKKLASQINDKTVIKNVMTPTQPLAMKLKSNSKQIEHPVFKNFYSSTSMRV